MFQLPIVEDPTANVKESPGSETQLLNFLIQLEKRLNANAHATPEILLEMLQEIPKNIGEIRAIIENLLGTKDLFQDPPLEPSHLLDDEHTWLHNLYVHLKKAETAKPANQTLPLMNAMSDLLHYNGSKEIRLGMIDFLIKGLKEGESFHYAPSTGTEPNRTRIALGLSTLHHCPIEMHHVFGVAGERHAIQTLKSILKGKIILTYSLFESAWTEQDGLSDSRHFNPLQDNLYRATPNWLKSKLLELQKVLPRDSPIGALVLSEIENPISSQNEKNEIGEMIMLMKAIKKLYPQILFICDRTQKGINLSRSYWEIVAHYARDLRENMVLICSAAQYFTAPDSHAAVIVTQNKSLQELLPIAISKSVLFADILGQYGFGYALVHRTPQAWCAYYQYHANNIHFLKVGLSTIGFGVDDTEYNKSHSGSCYVLANFYKLIGLPMPLEVIELLYFLEPMRKVEPTIQNSKDVATFLLVFAKIRALPISQAISATSVLFAINSDLPDAQLEEILHRLECIAAKAQLANAQLAKGRNIASHAEPLPNWIKEADFISRKPLDAALPATPKKFIKKTTIVISPSILEKKGFEESRMLKKSSGTFYPLSAEISLDAEIPETSRHTSAPPTPQHSTQATPLLSPRKKVKNYSLTSLPSLRTLSKRVPERNQTPGPAIRRVFSVASAAAHRAVAYFSKPFPTSPDEPEFSPGESSPESVENEKPVMESLWELKETTVLLNNQPAHRNAPPQRIAGIGVPNFQGTQEIRFGAILSLLEGLDGRPIQNADPVHNKSQLILSKAFSKLWKTDRLNPSMIFNSSGGTQAIKEISSFLRGKAIIAPSPLYMLWYGDPNKPNSVFTFSIMREPGFSLNPECLERGFDECREAAHQQKLQVGALVLVTPENPTPGCLDEKECREIIQVFLRILKKEKNPDFLFVLDHAYFKLSNKPSLIEIILKENPELMLNIVTCETGTKITSASGLRSGCIITANKLLQTHLLRESRQHNLFANTSVQFGYGYCLYRRTKATWKHFLDYYSERREHVYQGLEEIGANLPELVSDGKPIKPFNSEGSFYILSDWHSLKGLPFPREARDILQKVGKKIEDPTIETDMQAALVILALARMMFAPLSCFDQALAPAMILRITCADTLLNLNDILHRITILFSAAKRYKMEKDLPGFNLLKPWITSEAFHINTIPLKYVHAIHPHPIKPTLGNTPESQHSPLPSPRPSLVARALNFPTPPQTTPSSPSSPSLRINMRSMTPATRYASSYSFDSVRPPELHSVAPGASLHFQYPSFPISQLSTLGSAAPISPLNFQYQSGSMSQLSTLGSAAPMSPLNFQYQSGSMSQLSQLSAVRSSSPALTKKEPRLSAPATTAPASPASHTPASPTSSSLSNAQEQRISSSPIPSSTAKLSPKLRSRSLQLT